MVFSSLLFLFLFLPVVLTLNLLLPRSLRNLFLLGASVGFYLWGERIFVLVLLGSVGLNFGFGLWLGAVTHPGRRKFVLGTAVIGNLVLLAAFKYATFLAEALNSLLATFSVTGVPVPMVHLPLGVSFFTFQGLSYVIDVYRGAVPAERMVSRYALYVSFFPHQIAGPIVRYSDVAAQLAERVISLDGFCAGVTRFACGLAKKVLLANPLGAVADQIFGLPAHEVSTTTAWLGVMAYTLQIYLDFSGYTDMAIGLAQMFGIKFGENFNYPYTARSIQDFWRRWHMTLSGFFRDYVYIPLGGSRQGGLRTALNLLIVFALCGLWHGASWTFVVWGLFHGLFLSLERLGLGTILARLPQALGQVYTLLVVMVGWVFFRAETFGQAGAILQSMFGLGHVDTSLYPPQMFIDPVVCLAFVLGVIVCTPGLPALGRWLEGLLVTIPEMWSQVGQWILRAGSAAATSSLVAISAAKLLTGGHNPFIYFRF